jgi:hypothetical protein
MVLILLATCTSKNQESPKKLRLGTVATTKIGKCLTSQSLNQILTDKMAEKYLSKPISVIKKEEIKVITGYQSLTFKVASDKQEKILALAYVKITSLEEFQDFYDVKNSSQFEKVENIGEEALWNKQESLLMVFLEEVQFGITFSKTLNNNNNKVVAIKIAEEILGKCK